MGLLFWECFQCWFLFLFGAWFVVLLSVSELQNGILISHKYFFFLRKLWKESSGRRIDSKRIQKMPFCATVCSLVSTLPVLAMCFSVFYLCLGVLFNRRQTKKQVVWDADKRHFLRQNQLWVLIDVLHSETCPCVCTYIYINLSKHKGILHLILLQSVPADLTLISFLKELMLHSRPL